MQTKINVLLAALTVGTGPALAKRSDAAAAPGCAPAAIFSWRRYRAVRSQASGSFSWGVSAS